MPEAARVHDLTVHGDRLDPGPGSSNVELEGEPAWRAMIDTHACLQIPSDGAEVCFLGSMTVLINDQMATRVGDVLTGAGAPDPVQSGATHTLIGDLGFGLADPANQAEFCADMCALQKAWDGMTAAERQTALSDAINKQLGKSGVPQVDINPTSFPRASLNGQLNFEDWALEINDNLLNKSSLSDAEMHSLGNTVYHEARHGEQWYAMAQAHASTRGMTAEQLAQTMSIPEDVAAEAMAHPASGTTPFAVLGRTMYNSVYGPRRTYRNDVLNALAQPGRSQQTYDQYRALPEEADAWRTGDMMNSCTCP